MHVCMHVYVCVITWIYCHWTNFPRVSSGRIVVSGRVQSFLPAPHQAGDLEGKQRLHVERLKTGRSGDPCVHLLLYALPLDHQGFGQRKGKGSWRWGVRSRHAQCNRTKLGLDQVETRHIKATKISDKRNGLFFLFSLCSCLYLSLAKWESKWERPLHLRDKET